MEHMGLIFLILSFAAIGAQLTSHSYGGKFKCPLLVLKESVPT